MTRWRIPGWGDGRRAAAIAAAAATAVAGMGLYGCSLVPRPQLVQLPELPAAWSQFTIILQLTAVDGRDGTEQRLSDALPGSAVVLPVGRHTATVIVAEPVVTGPAGTNGRGAAIPPTHLRLRPAGAVVPLDLGPDGMLHVTWERGVLATLILDLWRGGANPWLLNIERLDQEIGERAGADPWALDRNAILAALQEGEMSATVIRPRRRHTISLPLLAGRWVWWDPLATPLHSDGRTAFTIQLPAGYHLLIHDSGAALAVHVSDDGTVLTTPAADPFTPTPAPTLARPRAAGPAPRSRPPKNDR